MIDWLTQTLASFHLSWREVIIGLIIFAVTFAGSLGLVTFLLVKLPVNYFHSSHERAFMTDRHRAVRWTGIIAKNAVGVVLVLLGIVMSVPGVPGQGFLTILLGVMLLDFPGKRRLELKIVSRPRILSAINQLRAKFDKPPLLLD